MAGGIRAAHCHCGRERCCGDKEASMIRISFSNDQLMAMDNAGVSTRDIAMRFGVTPWAITERIAKIRELERRQGLSVNE